MPKLQRSLFYLSLSLIPSFVLADGVPLSDAANTLTSLGEVLSKLLWAASIIVGIALIAAGFTQFQIHRRNPKLVPLATPVMYLILGIAAIGIPFINRITDFVGDNKKKIERAPAVTNNNNYSNDIDAPID